MSFTDALSRISEIQQQIAALDTGTLPDAATTAATGSAASSGTAADFADALADAQLSGADPASSALASDPGSLTSDASVPASDPSDLTTPAAAASGGAALPAAAGTELTSDQRRFAGTLSADTGLNPGVVCAWMVSEENGAAAQARQAEHNNDWLNIGYTDTATIGASDGIWSDPVSAAKATAQWLEGDNAIPGYGTASAGIQAILATVGQSPQAQISALQNSGWASSGYPDLDAVYEQVTGR